MALLKTYGSENLVRNQLPSTRSVKTMFNASVLELVGEAYLYTIRPFWFVESITTESYSYVGMDEATARLCQAEEETKWTKQVTLIGLSDAGLQIGNTVNNQVADVRAVPMGGLMWRVDVDVSWPTYTIERAY